MSKLTETQTLILTRASARSGNLALPLPEGLHGAAAKMAIGRMVKLGFIDEVDANIRRNEPLWRETGDGHGTTLIASEAGLAAVGIDPVVSRAVASARKAKAKPAPEAEDAESIPGRAGTKQAAIIALLQRPEGASVAEIVAATGWLAHSVRGMISGALKKKLGLPILSEKVEGRGTVHRFPPMD